MDCCTAKSVIVFGETGGDSLSFFIHPYFSFMPKTMKIALEVKHSSHTCTPTERNTVSRAAFLTEKNAKNKAYALSFNTDCLKTSGISSTASPTVPIRTGCVLTSLPENSTLTIMERNNQIQLFDSPQFGRIRVVTNENGAPLFAATDVASALGYTNPPKAVADHCKSGNITKRYVAHSNGIGGVNVLFIPESEVYRLVMRSCLPDAEKFQDWVCEEVLPAIHHTGGYIAAKEDETPAEIMARALKVADATLKRQAQRVQMLEGRVEVQQEHIRVLEPKAEYTDEVLQSPNTYTFTQMAKELDFRTVAHLTAYLKKKGIIFRQSGRWMTTADHSGKGYTKTRTVAFDHSDGRPDTTVYTVWTEPGRRFLHRICNTHKLEAVV